MSKLKGMRLFTTDSDSWGAMYKQASGSPFRLVLLLALCVAAAPGFPGDVVPIEPDRGHRKPDTRKTAAERKAEQRAAMQALRRLRMEGKGKRKEGRGFRGFISQVRRKIKG